MKAVVRTSTYPLHLEEPPKIHHVSSIENASFDPYPVTPCSTGTSQSHRKPVHRCLTYSSSEDDDDTPRDEIPSPDSTPQVQCHVNALQHPSSKYTLNMYVNLEEEEDFQTVSLDDEYWDMEEIPDRHLCIHEHSLHHGLCTYPCPYSDYTTSSYYDNLDLSDISWVWRSDNYIQQWRHPCTWWCWILNGLWLELNIYIYMNFRFDFIIPLY